eukprot:g66524.t1
MGVSGSSKSSETCLTKAKSLRTDQDVRQAFVTQVYVPVSSAFDTRAQHHALPRRLLP